MYIIALCDDDPEEIDIIENLIQLYHQENQLSFNYKIEKFNSAENLLVHMKETDCMPDLLLMDIFMSGKTGIEAVEELKNAGCIIPVVFLTTSTEYALKAYELDAVQYIVKPLQKERFFRAMNTAFGAMYKKKEESIIIKVANGIRQMPLDHIIYCEPQKNYQIIYLKTEALKVRMTAKELYGLLREFPQFGRCGSSYILNMDHIAMVDKGEIRMDNDTKIYIPRSSAAEFKKAYFDYYFGGRGDIC